MSAAGEPSLPLDGRRIVVTRRPEQSEWLCARLRERGATVVELPLIEVAAPLDAGPLERVLGALDAYDWIVLTSANAARAVAERLGPPDIAARRLAAVKVACIGPATAAALRDHVPGAHVDLEPASHDAEALLDALAAGARGRRFLLPTSDRAREVLADGLRARGAEVDVVVAYRTLAPAGLRERVLACLRDGAELMTFASPSAVENLMASAGDVAARIPAAVIGPVTEQACRRAGIEVRVVAAPSTSEGLADALERHFSRRAP